MKTRGEWGRWRLVVLASVLVVAPACSSSAGGMRGDGRSLGQRLSDRITYRPVYPQANPVPRTRPLFLSGYPGAQYGARGANRPVYPTTYQAVDTPWLDWLHHRTR